MASLKNWLNAFWRIPLKPFPKTISDVSSYARTNTWQQAVAWSAIIALIYQLHYIFILKNPRPPNLSFWSSMMFIVVLPIELLFFVFWIHTLFHKVFKRKRDCYKELLFVITAIIVGLSLLTIPISLIPQIGVWLGWAITIYQVLLVLLAIKTITKLMLWESIVVLIFSLLLTASIAVCLPLFIITMLDSTATLLR
jgi:hypothetical protein